MLHVAFVIHCSKKLGIAHGYKEITQTVLQVINEKRNIHSLKCSRKQKKKNSYANQRTGGQKPEKGNRWRNRGLMIWIGISIGLRIDLHIILNGTWTAQRYSNEILRPHLVPYAAVIGDSFLLMQDNVRNHTARLAENFLKLKQYSIYGMAGVFS
ncbi:hypothetical protein TNCV_600581 [Trichonephila clavipes]|nr:hypothetical protein TNCV_600581 [Trichonephila clavipes]